MGLGMTQKEITSWLKRAAEQKLTLGKSIHRLNVCATGFQFGWMDVHELEPAQ